MNTEMNDEGSTTPSAFDFEKKIQDRMDRTSTVNLRK